MPEERMPRVCVAVGHENDESGGNLSGRGGQVEEEERG